MNVDNEVIKALYAGAWGDSRVRNFSPESGRERQQAMSALVSNAGNNASAFIQVMTAWLGSDETAALDALDAVVLRRVKSVEILDYLWSLDQATDVIWSAHNIVDGFIDAVLGEDYAVCQWLFDKMEHLFSRSTWAWLYEDDFFEYQACADELREKYQMDDIEIDPGTDFRELFQRFVRVVQKAACEKCKGSPYEPLNIKGL